MKPIFKPKPPDNQAPNDPFEQTKHGMPVLWQIMNQNQKEDNPNAGTGNDPGRHLDDGRNSET